MHLSQRFQRVAAVGTASLLTLAALTGCGAKNSPLVVDGKGVSMPVVMTIDGDKVSMDEYRYYFLNMKYGYDNGDDTAWEGQDEVRAQLSDYVLKALQSNRAIRALADEYGLSLSDEEKASADSQLASVKESYDSEEAFQEAMTSAYLTEDLYLQLMQTSYLQQKVENHLFGEGGTMEVTDEVLGEFLQKRYAHVSHVLVTNETENAEALSQEILERARSGEDFATLVSQYNEDPGLTEDGYYFGPGEMVEEFEDASFALAEGEISDVVKTSYGYHIIKKLPIDQSYIDENHDALVTACKDALFNDLLEEKISKQEVTYNKNYDKISVETLH